MNLLKYGRPIAAAMTCLTCILTVCVGSAQSVKGTDRTEASSLWSHDNLFAWCVVPFDAKKRGPEERAQMLEKLGFKRFAYDWRENDVPTFDTEIEALQKHGIDLLAWWFPLDADNPMAKATLEIFKRHNDHPQLWIVQSNADMPKTSEEWAKLLPKGFPVPKTGEEFEKLSVTDKAQFQRAIAQLNANSLPKTPEEQERRVKQEAERVKALVTLAAPYGSKVELYNHNGWFGMEDNQLAIIDRLKEMGVTDVGMVYNFSHARDEVHDDTTNFPALWKKIKPYVVAINITGTHLDGTSIYPSQGDRELEMMRTIQESGWSGPIGLIAEKGGDAEITLRNYLVGLDWLAAELKQPGSGGPPPFPLVR
jgi:hypothetical protein